MNKIKEMLNIEENHLDIKYFLMLMFVAFAFSVSIRYLWIDAFGAYETFKWNSELMINTNDGYFWAEGARDLLSGIHQENDLSPILQPLPILTAFIAQLLPVSFEALLLWMPTFIGSLLVVPIMLIARLLKQDVLGFSAALLGSIAWSYYNRTMMGYYDTDMLVVVLPTFMVWGALYALSSQKTHNIMYAPLLAILSVVWHPGTVHILNGVFIMTLVYTFLYERKNLYYYRFLTVFVLVLTTLPIWLKLTLMVSLIAVYHFAKEKLTQNMIIAIAIFSSIIYLLFGGFDWIMGILHNAYITRLLAADELDMTSLKFFAVVSTVREAGQISFETFANRISGDTLTFWMSLIGYIFLLIRYRIMLLSLPMVILGFFALQGGLRFTVFSVPFMALGVMYLVFVFAKFFERFFVDKSKVYAKYAFVALGTIGVLYPNIKHIQAYMVPTVFTQDEVNVLSKLGKMASKEDYVISWWDYGYPIRYYADMKTLVDGGKHSGNVNFPVAFELTSEQVEAANMARLDVEFTEKSFTQPCGASIECMLKAYNVTNPNAFLKSLNKKDFKRPAKTRDIYFYLPNKMLNILPTVDMFSNIDLLSGISGQRPFFYMTKSFKEENNTLNLSNNIILDKKTATVKIGNQKIQLSYYAHTFYDKAGVYKVVVQQLNKNKSGISAIFMQSHNQFLIVDNRILNSLYFRLFVLEDYDKDLFELVITSPQAKVYKLKI